MDALLKKYHDFYAPEAIVFINDEKVTKHGIGIVELKIEQSLSGANSFSFTVANALDYEYNLNKKYTDLLQFGNKVEIKIGYRSEYKSIITGVITSISWNFTEENYLDVEVEGYDYLFLLTKGKSNKAPWKNRKDSDIVKDIVQQTKYNVIKHIHIDNTETDCSYRRQEKSESDYDFIVNHLAKKNGYEVFVEGEDFYFRKPPAKESSAFSMKYGEELLTFNPQFNLAQQVSRVEVYGWDPGSKRKIIGKAGSSKTGASGKKEATGSSKIKLLLKDDVVYKVRVPVCSQKEADQLALSLFQKRANLLVTGSATSIGIPDLKPGIFVELKNLGKRFSCNYYVDKVTHGFADGAYKMNFNIRGNTYHEST